VDERDDFIFKYRISTRDRIKRQQLTIDHLRQQYLGAVPLDKQEVRGSMSCGPYSIASLLSFQISALDYLGKQRARLTM
jgi:hypothetical protein